MPTLVIVTASATASLWQILSRTEQRLRKIATVCRKTLKKKIKRKDYRQGNELGSCFSTP